MFNTAALRAICHPNAEAMSDKVRLDCFVEMGNDAADEIDRLRAALRQAEAYWSDYHVPCVYEEHYNDCDLCPVIAAVRAALQPIT